MKPRLHWDILSGILSLIFLAACGAEFEHDSPFDPNAPLEKQAEGQLTGTVRLDGEDDHSLVTVKVANEQGFLSTQSLGNGEFQLNGIPPGAYTATFDAKNFVPVTQQASFGIGEKKVMHGITLMPVNGIIRGSVQLVDAPAGLSSSGILVTAKRLLTARSTGTAPRLIAASASTTAPATYPGLTGADGSFSIRLPAGGYVLSFEKDGLPAVTTEQIEVSGDSPDIEISPVEIRPISGYISINGLGLPDGMPVTATDQVTVYLTAYNAQFVELADEPLFLATTRFAITPFHSYTLVGSDGVKTIYARFDDGDGHYSPVYSATIRLDREPPAGCNATGWTSGTYTRSVSVTLQLNCDEPSETQIVVSNDLTFNEPVQGFSPVVAHLLESGDGPKTVYVRFADPAGNTVVEALPVIHLDTVAPPLPLIATLSTVTTDVSIDAALVNDAPRDTEGPAFAYYQIVGGDKLYWTAATPAATPVFTYDLPTDGEYRLSVRAVDKAGNISGESAINVVRDTTAPAAVTAFLADAGNEYVNLSWTPSASLDVVGYRLYYGDSSSNWNGTYAAEGKSPLELTKRSAYRLNGVMNGKTFTAGLTAIDHAGNESDFSITTVLPNEITPVRKQQYFTPSSSLAAVDADTGHALAVYSNSAVVWDMTDPGAPSVVAKFNGKALLPSARLDWPYVYAHENGALRAWNVASGTPVEVDSDASTGIRKIHISFGALAAVENAELRYYVRNGDGTLGIKRTVTGITPSASSVYCVAERCYVGGYGYLRIYDVSGTGAITLLGELATGFIGSVNDIAVHNDLAYTAAGADGLRIVDVSDPINPAGLGQYATLNAVLVSVEGPYAYVSNRESFSSGLNIFDISDPAMPRLVGYYPQGRHAAKVFGNYLLTGSLNNPEWIELSSPIALIPLTTHTVAGHPNTFRRLDLDGTELAGANWDTWSVLDGRGLDGVKPLEFDAGQADDIAIRGDLLYVAKSYSTSGSLKTYRRDSGTLTLLDTLTYSSSTNTGSPRRLLVEGMYAYAADYALGMRIVDIRDPANISDIASCQPTDVGQCGGASEASGVAIAKHGNHVFLGDNRTPRRLWAIDVTIPTAPSPVTWHSLPNAVDTICNSGNRMIVGTYSGHFLLEYNEANNSFTEVELPTSGRLFGCSITGSLAYVSLWISSSLSEVRVIDLDDMSVVATYQPQGQANDLIPTANRLFIGAYGNGIVTTKTEP